MLNGPPRQRQGSKYLASSINTRAMGWVGHSVMVMETMNNQLIYDLRALNLSGQLLLLLSSCLHSLQPSSHSFVYTPLPFGPFSQPIDKETSKVFCRTLPFPPTMLTNHCSPTRTPPSFSYPR